MLQDDWLDSVFLRLGICVVEGRLGKPFLKGYTLLSPEGWSQHYRSKNGVASWFLSRAAEEIPEYLALEYFQSELKHADAEYLEEIALWLISNQLTDRTLALREKLEHMALDYSSNMSVLKEHAENAMRARFSDNAYFSFGRRMTDRLRQHKAALLDRSLPATSTETTSARL